METTKAQNPSKLLIVILGILTAFGPISIDLYLPGLLEIAKEMKVGADAAQYTLTSFFIGLSIGQLLYGPISDKWGRRKPLLFGIIIFIISSIFISRVTTIESLIAWRFIQAFGSCVGMVLTKAIIRDMFDPKDVAKVFSLILLVMGVAPIFAPVLGGQILLYFSWRGMFIFLTIFGLLAFIGTWFLIEESLKQSVPLKSSFKNYLLLFKDKQFLIASLVSGTVLGAMFSYISSSSLVFIEVMGVKNTYYPILFGLNAFGFICMSQINIRLLNRYSLDQVLSLGINLFFFGSLVLALCTYLHLGIYAFETSLFFMVASIGIVMPNMAAKALEFQAHRAAVASALMGSLQFLVASFGTMIVAYFSYKREWSMVIGVVFFTTITYILHLWGLGKKPRLAT